VSDPTAPNIPPAPLWKTAPGPVPYLDALAGMEARVAAIQTGTAPELIWLLEHPPLYTAGTSADAAELIDPGRFPVFETGRGGRHTYHGPGQRVAYVMLDLNRRGPDLRAYVRHLEDWMIRTLAYFGITGERREGRIGIWVAGRDDAGRITEKKIGAIGVRVRRWVTFHGLALNVNPDLGHFEGIVPCGIRDYGVTSLHDQGVNVSMDEVDAVLKETFKDVFGGG